jgi:hypothetical protein
MHAPKAENKSKPQLGLFLFFVIGLFMLQIAFAFTIHGDIGPRTNILPGIDKPAPPFLVGRIDSLVSNAKKARPNIVAPEGAFAPAIRNDKVARLFPSAKIDTEIFVEDRSHTVRSSSDKRFFEYQIIPGDNLVSISKRLYGSTRMVQAITRLNRITNEKSLQPGAVLKVPGTGMLKSIHKPLQN